MVNTNGDWALAGKAGEDGEDGEDGKDGEDGELPGGSSLLGDAI